jgi:predicted ribosomally synthesized peptide with SipW-like signal peptide
MKKILGSILTIAVVAGVAVAATGAYFTDTAQVTNNIITSGTLDLALGGTIPIQVDNINLAPGDTIDPPAYIELRNTGTLDMLFRMYIDPVSNVGNLASQLNVVITINPSLYVYTDGYLPYGPANTVIWTGTLDQLFGQSGALDNEDAAFDHDGWPLNPGYAAVYKVEVELDSGANNDYQGKTFNGTIVAEGTQFANQTAGSVVY